MSRSTLPDVSASADKITVMRSHSGGHANQDRLSSGRSQGHLDFCDNHTTRALDVPKHLSIKDRKKQRQLKRRLLRKRLRPMLNLVFKAFSSGYESICVLLLQGVVSQLRDPTFILQTASVRTLARRLQRFINKHGEAINTLLHLAVEQGTPNTTNAIESNNGLLKPFSLIAKFFPLPEGCQSLFAGVSLMENFDVKTRGPNKGTSAMQRAEINLDDLGATDFFSAVGLPEPQISLACTTD